MSYSTLFVKWTTSKWTKCPSHLHKSKPNNTQFIGRHT